MNKTAVVATFNDKSHAEPIVNRLRNWGFHPEVQDEARWHKAHLSEDLAGVKVRVPEDEFAPVREKLNEIPVCDLEQSVCCPECGSPDVDYPQVTRKFILPSLHTVLFKLGIVEKQFYCNTCQATWPLRDKLEGDRDALNWPVKNSPLHRNTEMTP